MLHNKQRHDYISSVSQSRENSPTSKLQHEILEHICVTKNSDYKSIISSTGRNRITIRQSLRILIRRKLVDELKSDSGYEKSKRHFKPTDKGKFFCIIGKYSTISNIDRIHSLPGILEAYNEYADEAADYGYRRPKDETRNFVASLCHYDLFDDSGKCLLKDEIDLLKYYVKRSVLEKLADKYVDIENILTPDTWIYMASETGFVSPRLKEIAIKIREDLDEIIEFLNK